MKQVLITGANRGIGLELTRQLLERGNRVIATCRQPDHAQTLLEWADQYGDQLFVAALDVADDNSVRAAQEEIESMVDSLDILINNAGIGSKAETLAAFDDELMQRVFNVNVIGAMRVTTRFLDLLIKGREPKLINISSQLGSLQKMRPNWGRYSYNSSKAALNMVTGMLAFDLQEMGIAVCVIHPGWVQTDMGGPHAAVTPHDSAAGILKLAAELTLTNTGNFYVYNGEEHPW